MVEDISKELSKNAKKFLKFWLQSVKNSLQIALRLEIFPIFDNAFYRKYNACIGNVEEEGGFTPHVGLLFPSEPVSPYSCKNIRKTNDNDRTHKNDASTILT